MSTELQYLKFFNFHELSLIHNSSVELTERWKLVRNLPFIYKNFFLNLEQNERVELWKKITNPTKLIIIDQCCWAKDEFLATEFFQILELHVEAFEHDSQKISQIIYYQEFALFLMKKFIIKPFDQEEPDYPDHDRYWVSDDFSFIFEYEECHEEYVTITKRILQVLLAELGVEKINVWLTELHYNHVMQMEENIFSEKLRRDEEQSIPSYLEALNWTIPITAEKILNKLKKKIGHIQSPNLDENVDFKNDILENENKLFYQWKMACSALIVLKDFYLNLLPITIEDWDINLFKRLNKLIQFSVERLDQISGESKLSSEFILSEIEIKDLVRYAITEIKKMKTKVQKLQKYELELQAVHWGELWGEFSQAFFEAVENNKPFSEIHFSSLDDFVSYQQADSLLSFLYNYFTHFIRGALSGFTKEQWIALIEKEKILNYNENEISLEIIVLTAFFDFKLNQIVNPKATFRKQDWFFTISWENFKKAFEVMVSQNFCLSESDLDFFKEGSFWAISDKSQLGTAKMFLESILKYHFLKLNLVEISLEDRKYVGGVLLRNSDEYLLN